MRRSLLGDVSTLGRARPLLATDAALQQRERAIAASVVVVIPTATVLVVTTDESVWMVCAVWLARRLGILPL